MAFTRYSLENMLEIHKNLRSAGMEQLQASILENFKYIDDEILTGKSTSPSPSSGPLLCRSKRQKFAAGAIVFLPPMDPHQQPLKDTMSKEFLPRRGFNHPAIITESPWLEYGEYCVNIAICSSHPVESEHYFQLVDNKAKGIYQDTGESCKQFF